MTLNELAYMVLETARQNHIVDDERLDNRLIMDWIDLKRAQYIRNSHSTNPSDRINLNFYQTIPLGVYVDNVYDAGNYPYSNDTTQLYKIVVSEDIPSIVEDKSGPMILTIESDDLMKLPFSIVPYDHMRFAGNGRFNSNLIFASVRDNKIYFKYNSFFDSNHLVHIRAVFENPRDIPDFSITNDRYPASLELIEYIKNGIYDVDFRAMNQLGSTDEINDSTGEIKQ